MINASYLTIVMCGQNCPMGLIWLHLGLYPAALKLLLTWYGQRCQRRSRRALPASILKSFPESFRRHLVLLFQEAATNQGILGQLNPDGTEWHIPQLGDGFDGSQDLIRTADMMALSRRLLAHNGHNVATNSDGGKLFLKARHFFVDIVATVGHSVVMRKKQPFKASLPKTDIYEAKRHRVYGPEDVFAAVDAIAELNGERKRGPRSRSEIMIDLAKPYIRKNKARLVAAGKPLPSFLTAK
jgi:hypothetical protein